MNGGTLRGSDKEDAILCELSKHDQTISGFSTVSDEAVLVLIKTIPIHILADKMRRI